MGYSRITINKTAPDQYTLLSPTGEIIGTYSNPLRLKNEILRLQAVRNSCKNGGIELIIEGPKGNEDWILKALRRAIGPRMPARTDEEENTAYRGNSKTTSKRP